MSHSARSAWIETEYGLPMYDEATGRTPQGVRGLKLIILHEVITCFRSHSARSAWIETRRYKESLLKR